MSCPHCEGPARIRQSRTFTALFRELKYICLDADCGHTFRAELQITHTISPSARPNPGVRLPLWQPTFANNDNSTAAAGVVGA